MMRRTRQKSLIQEIFRTQEHPASISKLHSLAAEQIPGIAYSTVFRQVQTMLEAGDIAAVEIEFRPTRYESAEHRNRRHFFCRRCEEAYRLDDASLGAMDLGLPTCKVEDYRLILYGICENCLQLGLAIKPASRGAVRSSCDGHETPAEPSPMNLP